MGKHEVPVINVSVRGIDTLIAVLKGIRKSCLDTGIGSGEVDFVGRVKLYPGKQPKTFKLTILTRN